MVLSGLRGNPKAFLSFWNRRGMDSDAFKTLSLKDLIQLEELLQDAKCPLEAQRTQVLCSQIEVQLEKFELNPTSCVDLLGVSTSSKARRLISFVEEEARSFRPSEMAQALSHAARLRFKVCMDEVAKMELDVGNASIGVSACAAMDVECPLQWLRASLAGVFPVEPKGQALFGWALFPRWPRKIINLMAAFHTWDTWSDHERRYFVLMAYEWHWLPADWAALDLSTLRVVYDVASSDVAPPLTSVLHSEVRNTLAGVGGVWISERAGPYFSDFVCLRNSRVCEKRS